MIDFATEEVISLNDAAKRIPKRRAGRKAHIATLYRWTQRGVKGVILETIQVGGTRCTSVEAMQRFFDRLTVASRGLPPPPPPMSAARRRELERVDRELDRWLGPRKTVSSER